MNAADARLLATLDLTSLGEDDTLAAIQALCARAAASAVRPAAVCVFSEHIVTARAALNQAGAPGVAVATVVNFPDGANNPGRALSETRRAISAGVDEIDLGIFLARIHRRRSRERPAHREALQGSLRVEAPEGDH